MGDSQTGASNPVIVLVVLFIVAWSARVSGASSDVWTFTGPGGGAVHVLVIVPGQPDTLYAGTEEGGLFKSDDGGVSWGTLNRGLPPRADVRAVVIDPEATTTLFVGTHGAGAFKSEDGGAHWTATGPGLNSVDVNALAVDPHTPSIVYAGTRDAGVFKSTDAGAHWTAVNRGLTNIEINSLAVDPATPSTVYAATQGAGVFKTTDGGGHWRGADSAPRYVNAVVVNPLTPAIVYAASFGVHQSRDGGATWIPAGTGIGDPHGYTPQIFSLAIDPTEPDTLWAGTLGDRLFVSTDGAVTWSPASADLPDNAYDITFALAIDASTVYAGGYGVFKSTDRGASWTLTGLPASAYASAIEVDATDPAILYLATTSEGLFKSTDGAASWRRASAGLTSMSLTDVAIDPAAPRTVLVATEAGVFKSTDAADSWNITALHGDTRALAIARTDPSTFFAASYDPSRGYDVFVSTDTGVTWHPRGLVVGFITGLATDPNDPARVYAGGVPFSHGLKTGGISKSTDAGAHWTPTGLVSFDAVRPLAVDPESSSVLYAAYGAGLLKSTDGGDTWRAVNGGLPDGGAGQLVFDPLDPRRLFVAAGAVFTSTDGAASWTGLGDTLADSASVLAIDPVTGIVLYAGTPRGVFALHRTDVDATRPVPPTPTPTSTPDPRCAPDQITLVPAAALPGANVMLSGLCYFLHSGQHAEVYFDTTRVGTVAGDTLGNYALSFAVPADAAPGPHRVRVTGAQSATFEVQSDDATATPTPTLPFGVTDCQPDYLTVVPNGDPAGTRIIVSGQCYNLHSGRSGTIYFDDTPLGNVRGDTPGNYAGSFIVPIDAAAGAHLIGLRAPGGTSQYQSAPFAVEAAEQAPSPTPTATATGTAASDDGGCSMTPQQRRPAAPGLILLALPALFRRGGKRASAKLS